jgi:hypothetical protein
VSTVYEALPENDEEHHNDSTTHAIGLALLSGFALMLLYVPTPIFQAYKRLTDNQDRIPDASSTRDPSSFSTNHPQPA